MSRTYLFLCTLSLWFLPWIGAQANWIMDKKGPMANLEVGQWIAGPAVLQLAEKAYLKIQLAGGEQLQFWGPGEMALLTQTSIFLKSGHLRFLASGETASQWQIQTPNLQIHRAAGLEQWEVLTNVFSAYGELISEVCTLQGAGHLGIGQLQLPAATSIQLLGGQIFSTQELFPGMKIEVQNYVQALDPEALAFLLGPSGQDQFISPLLMP